MGLFSETKIYVATSAMHLVDASATPTRDAVLTAILKNEKVPETILKSLVAGMGNKVRRAHDYAKEHYYLGLPEGETQDQDPVNAEELVPYIREETGNPRTVLIRDHGYTQYDPRIAVYEYLLNTRGYDSDTNQIADWPADLEFTPSPIYNVNINSFPRKVELQRVRLAADPAFIEIVYDLYVEHNYIVRDNEGNVTSTEKRWIKDEAEYIETVPVPEGNTVWKDACLSAIYQKVDDSGQPLPYQYVWVYRFKDNKYPELHPGANQIAGEFMPVIPLRYGNVDYTDASIRNEPPEEDNLYSTSIQLLKKLGLNFHDLGASLNMSPDIADVDNAYVMWGIDLQTDFPISLFYLTEFFDNLRMIQNVSESTFLNHVSDPSKDSEPVNGYSFNRTLLDQSTESYVRAFDEYGLVLYLYHDYITSRTTVGTIGTGKVGYAEKSIETYTVKISYQVEVWEGEYETRTETQTRLKLVLKAQVLPNQVKTVSVHNLKLINNIYKNDSVYVSLSDVRDDPDNHNFIIPIQYDLAAKYTLPQRNVLYADSTLLVINAIEKVKLKWYETGFFKFVIIIVAVVITIYTGQAWIGGLAAAAEVSAVALLVFLGETILIGMAVNMAIDWIVTEFGDQIGVVGMIAVAITAVIVSGGILLGGNASQFMMTTAQYMMQGATALISSVNEFLVEKAKGIQNEYAAFTEEMDGLWNELDEAQDLLDWKSDLDPLMFSRPARLQIVPSETPSAFYTRCLGLPDNTMFTIHDQIPGFIDQHLKLDRNISPDMYSMNSYS